MTQPLAPHFTVKLTDPQGNPISAPDSFVTPQGALLFAERQDGPVDGAIYSVEGGVPKPYIRYVKGVPEEVLPE
jgi:hypothetical protein